LNHLIDFKISNYMLSLKDLRRILNKENINVYYKIRAIRTIFLYTRIYFHFIYLEILDF